MTGKGARGMAFFEMTRIYLASVAGAWNLLLLGALVLVLAFRPEVRVRLEGLSPRLQKLLFAAIVLVGVGQAARLAWVCDDAFISFRYAANLVGGQGLVWNPGERVEGYTNFLWTFVLAGAIRGWSPSRAARLLLGRRPARARRHRIPRRGAAVGRFHVTDLHVQIRRLPKPVVAMVAGYAVGGGQVLHLVCDLTIAADNARFGQTGPRVGSFDGGFGAGDARQHWSAPRRPRRSGSCAASTTPSRRSRWGSSTPSCRSRSSRRRPSLVPRDARALPLRPAAAEGQLPRRRGRAERHPAARPRHQPALLRLRRGAEGREAYKAQAQARLLAVPRRLEPLAHLAHGGAAADAPGRGRPGAGRHRAGRHRRHVPRVTFVAAMLGALFIQVGTNLSNDYSDARRGADTEDRLGPVRVTAGGLVPPRQVLVATYVAFGLAVLAGVYLIATAGWELLLVGAASILAGVLYTGGPRPYGYEGLGEVFVFLFFGVVAVTGSYFAQIEQLTWEAFVLAVPVGLLASAILVVNNVRDLETDRRAGKRTLAVRLGWRGHAASTRRWSTARSCPRAAVAAGLGRAVGMAGAGRLLALPLAVPVVGPCATGPMGRRSTGARSHRDAPARVLRAPVGGDPGELMAELTVETVGLRSRAPLRPRGACSSERELLQVRVDFGGDDFGEGEAAPLEAYDGVSLAAVRAALDAYAGVLDRASPGSTHAELLAACAAERPLPQALAAVDLALWDRAGRRTGFPVAKLIAAGAVAGGRGQRRRRHRGPRRGGAGGERCGRGRVPLRQAQGRRGRRRRAGGRRARGGGDAVALRVDANGAWARPTRRSPTCAHSLRSGSSCARSRCTGRGMRTVRTRSPVPVAMDETAAERGAPGSGAADAVCLKISRCGGISGCCATPGQRERRAPRSTWRRTSTVRWGWRRGCMRLRGCGRRGQWGSAGWPLWGGSRGWETFSRPSTGSLLCLRGRGCSGERQRRLGREAGVRGRRAGTHAR